MMKLLMISGDRSLVQGKASAFSSMLEEFHKHFERIDILCPRTHVSGSEVRQIFGNVFIHPARGSRLMQPFFIRRMGKKLFRDIHHDVMTVHEYPPFYNGIGARMLKRAIGIPAVLEIHHIVGWPRASSFSEWIGRLMTKWFIGSHARSFDAVRVVNRSVQSTLVAWGVPSANLSVIPSVYLDHALVESTKNCTKVFDAVFCSRLVDNKGLLQVIDAYARIPSATLCIIGDGPLKRVAEERVRRHNLASRITFAGWMPTPEATAKAIASGQIFIMNSKSEGNPRVAVEAMAYGLPILTTCVGIMPDVVEDGVQGMFTDGSSEDLAAKLRVLVADPARMQTMGAAARGVTQRFEKRVAIKAYADFLLSQVH